MPFGEMLIARAIFARFNGGRAQPPHLPLPAHVPPPPGPLLPAPSSLLWICLIVKNQYCPFSFFFGVLLLFKPSKWIICLHLMPTHLPQPPAHVSPPACYCRHHRHFREFVWLWRTNTIFNFVFLEFLYFPIIWTEYLFFSLKNTLYLWSDCQLWNIMLRNKTPPCGCLCHYPGPSQGLKIRGNSKYCGGHNLPPWLR